MSTTMKIRAISLFPTPINAGIPNLFFVLWFALSTQTEEQTTE